MFKILTAIHVMRASDRYGQEKPTFKEAYEFVKNSKFEFNFQKRIVYSIINGLQRYEFVPVRYVPFDGFQKIPMGSVPMGRRFIELNPEYAAKLFYAADDVETAIKAMDDVKFTIGHEMGHVTYDNGCDWIFMPLQRKRFINWVNEEFADMFSLTMAAENDRERFISSLERKRQLKKIDKDTNYHPSIQRRKEYARNFSFSDDLIYAIAIDTKCKSKKLIRNILIRYGFVPSKDKIREAIRQIG